MKKISLLVILAMAGSIAKSAYCTKINEEQRPKDEMGKHLCKPAFAWKKYNYIKFERAKGLEKIKRDGRLIEIARQREVLIKRRKEDKEKMKRYPKYLKSLADQRGECEKRALELSLGLGPKLRKHRRGSKKKCGCKFEYDECNKCNIYSKVCCEAADIVNKKPWYLRFSKRKKNGPFRVPCPIVDYALADAANNKLMSLPAAKADDKSIREVDVFKPFKNGQKLGEQYVAMVQGSPIDKFFDPNTKKKKKGIKRSQNLRIGFNELAEKHRQGNQFLCSDPTLQALQDVHFVLHSTDGSSVPWINEVNGDAYLYGPISNSEKGPYQRRGSKFVHYDPDNAVDLWDDDNVDKYQNRKS